MSRPRISPKFPEGYGDFKLISSDNVIFYFPKFLLSYMSPVFATMFAAGDSSGATQVNELHLTETSTTIDELLHYLDPKKKPLSPSLVTVEAVLEAGQKYDIPQIATWWEEELTTKIAGKQLSEIDVVRPMDCLAIATRFNLTTLTRLCLKEVVKAPLTSLRTHLQFESQLFVSILTLRATRVDWFEHKFANYFQGIPNLCINNTQEKLNPYNWPVPVRDITRIARHDGMYHQAMAVTRALHQEPSWVTLEKHLRAWGTAPCGCYSSSKDLFNSWKSDITRMESELPDLP